MHNSTTMAARVSVGGPVLTRALLGQGGIEAIYAKDAPGLRLLTEEERSASLAATLKQRPNGPVWIFGYGSLIWNPALKFTERRTARVDGWHRAFCMSIIAGRASPAAPGLMLGLDEGGHCLGCAYRLDDADLARELSVLWRREMQCRGAYIPRWIELIGEDGRPFGSAVAFTINPDGEKYAGKVPVELAANRIAIAAGGLGSCADYLLQTRDGLRAHDIPDADLEELASQVMALQTSHPLRCAAQFDVCGSILRADIGVWVFATSGLL
jgi:cation transport protein ChaC